MRNYRTGMQWAAAALLWMGGASLVWAFPFGPPAGVTPAPGDQPGVACTRCHRGTALNGGGGSVKVAFPGGLVYTPGQAQTLTITVTDAAAVVFGFEMTARLESGPSTQQAGSFTAGQNQRVVCSNNQPMPAGGCADNGLEWIEHTLPSPTNTIQVQWTPPATASGNIHIYVAANAANGDETPGNDHIYGAGYVLIPAAPSSATPATISSVVNGASGAPTIETCSMVTIYGSNFATTTATWNGAITGGVYPTTLAGATVSIDGKPAALAFVSPTQINALAPLGMAPGPVSVSVGNANGWSAAVMAQVAEESPAFFTYSQGQNRYIAGLVAISGTPVTYQYLAPQGLLDPSLTARAAKPGDIVLLYGTGFGPTAPQINPELVLANPVPLAHRGNGPTAPVIHITIGGQEAQVQFAGMIAAGVYQFNVVVPQVANGDQAVVATTLGGVSPTQQVYIPVQQ